MVVTSDNHAFPKYAATRHLLQTINEMQRQFRSSSSIIWRLLFLFAQEHFTICHLENWSLWQWETCVILGRKRHIMHVGKDSELTIPNDCARTSQKVNNKAQPDKQQQWKNDTRMVSRCVSMPHCIPTLTLIHMQITWMCMTVRLLRLYKPTATWSSNESKFLLHYKTQEFYIKCRCNKLMCIYPSIVNNVGLYVYSASNTGCLMWRTSRNNQTEIVVVSFTHLPRNTPAAKGGKPKAANKFSKTSCDDRFSTILAGHQLDLLSGSMTVHDPSRSHNNSVREKLDIGLRLKFSFVSSLK